jgi:hypothetical protein
MPTIARPVLPGLYQGGPLTEDLDFAKFKAVSLACDNGVTVPSAPVVGQWFIHTPAGRSILMQYNGTSWSSIMSFGTMTLYVDKTDGTDDISYGTGVDTNAFKTVQYAIDLIPPVFSGNVIVYITNESYSETVTIQGKNAAGAYTITLQGTRTIIESLACGAGCLQGDDAGIYSHQYAAIVRLSGTWTTGPHQRDKKWVRMTSGAAYANDPDTDSKLIDGSNSTSTRLRPVGKFTNGAPTTNDTFNIEEPGTQITKVKVGAGQKGVYINDIDMLLTTGTHSDLAGLGASIRYNRCRFAFGSTSSIWFEGCKVILNCCYVYYCRVFCRATAMVSFGGCYSYYVGVGFSNIQGDSSAYILVGDGTILDGGDLSSSYGFRVAGLALGNFNGNILSASVSTFRPTIRNCAYGVLGSLNGVVLSAHPCYVLFGDDVMPNAIEQATGTSSSKLIDNSVDFTAIGIGVGDLVFNMIDFTYAFVTNVDSANQLALGANIMASGEYYRIMKASTLNTTRTSASTGAQIQETT